jgi:uncharacterized protein (UPF0335 family)
MEKIERSIETNKANLSDEQKNLLKEALSALENDKPVKDKIKEAKEKKKGKTNDLP